MGLYDRLKLMRAEMGYRGERLKGRVEQEIRWKMEKVKRAAQWGRYPVEVEPDLHQSRFL